MMLSVYDEQQAGEQGSEQVVSSSAGDSAASESVTGTSEGVGTLS